MRSAIIQRGPKAAWRYFISLPLTSIPPMEQSRQPKDIYFIADEPFFSFVAANYPNRSDWPGSLCVWQKPTNKAIYQSRLRCRALSLLHLVFALTPSAAAAAFFARCKQRHAKLTGLGGGCLFLLAVDG
jgi:hypothetical protein